MPIAATRLLTFALVAVYACAGMFGGTLHMHQHEQVVLAVADHDCEHGGDVDHKVDPHHPSHSQHCHAVHAHGDHDHAPMHAAQGDHHTAHCATGSESHDSHQGHEHDDCAVCQALGQVSLPVVYVQIELLLGLCHEPPVDFVCPVSYGVARATLHLRAGPAC